MCTDVCVAASDKGVRETTVLANMVAAVEIHNTFPEDRFLQGRIATLGRRGTV